MALKMCIKCGSTSKKKCVCKKPKVIALKGSTRTLRVEVTNRFSCKVPVEILNLPKPEATFIINKHFKEYTMRTLNPIMKYSKSLKRK